MLVLVGLLPEESSTLSVDLFIRLMNVEIFFSLFLAWNLFCVANSYLIIF